MKYKHHLLLFPIALTIHNLEEMLLLPQWSAQGKGPIELEALPFVFTTTVITLWAYLLYGLTFSQKVHEKAERLLTGYTGAMFLNIFFPHLLGSIVYREILPGTATALFCMLPATLFLLLQSKLPRSIIVKETLIVSLSLIAFIALSLSSISLLL